MSSVCKNHSMVQQGQTDISVRGRQTKMERPIVALPEGASLEDECHFLASAGGSWVESGHTPVQTGKSGPRNGSLLTHSFLELDLRIPFFWSQPQIISSF